MQTPCHLWSKVVVSAVRPGEGGRVAALFPARRYASPSTAGGSASPGDVETHTPHSDANETAAFKLQCICLTVLAPSVAVPVRENLDGEIAATEITAIREVAGILLRDLVGEY
jgi:hypothetical protein